VFTEILPQYGYAVRGEQIALAEEILQALHSRKTILAEAEVGTGKTHAYLVAALLAKRGRLNDFWNKGFYPKMAYADMARMPIVVATSSIALQKAIVTDYIPELSGILLENGVIKTPLTAVLRKGRAHYLCDRYLRAFYRHEEDIGVKRTLKPLFAPSSPIDLAEVGGLAAYVRRHICVPKRCDPHCPCLSVCRYQRFVRAAMNPAIDIQVVNHNYLVADAIHRESERRPLLPNYQAVIIDEAHKLLPASRSMYGTELSSEAAPSVLAYLKATRFSIK
jgi:ATP-dependent DNA helicase DinG